MVNIDAPAPSFSLPDQDGTIRTLADYAGQWVLLYFYPKDDTPGCTTEACGLRDNLEALKEKNLAILGVSTDSVASHKQFADKFSLPFPLLADEAKEVVNAYGVWAEKSMYGKTYMGTLRSSFLIRPDGTLAKIYEKVKPEEHAGEILKDMEGFTK